LTKSERQRFTDDVATLSKTLAREDPLCVWGKKVGEICGSRPDYDAAMRRRKALLTFMKRGPLHERLIKDKCRGNHIWFTECFLDTTDPRNVGKSHLPATMPFILFDAQKELMQFWEAGIKAEVNLLLEKSREMGATWCAIAYSNHDFLFVDDVAIGWGSLLAKQVDEIGNSSSIFHKMRQQLANLDPIFYPSDFDVRKNLAKGRIWRTGTHGASIVGEIGEQQGRGGRTTYYFKDESSHYEHPDIIEASLSETTRVQIDMSSVSHFGYVFRRKSASAIPWRPGMTMERGSHYKYVMPWYMHPEKNKAWYDAKFHEAESKGLVHVHRQEIDMDYDAWPDRRAACCAKEGPRA
jgi:phage terminase large subunit